VVEEEEEEETKKIDVKQYLIEEDSPEEIEQTEEEIAKTMQKKRKARL